MPRQQRGNLMTSIQETWEKFEWTMSQVDLLQDGYEAVISQYKANCDRFILELMQNQLEECDEILRKNAYLRKDWVVVRKTARTLQTRHGTLTYVRRYYRHQATGEYSYLVDHLVNLSPYDRVDPALRIHLAELGSEMSYRKSAQLACEGAVSHQTVMTALRNLEFPEIPVMERKEDVPAIHIQVDEDHITLQSRDMDAKKKGIVKLAVLHDPIKAKGKRRYIPSKFVMTDAADEKNEDFWERVSYQLMERYGDLGCRPVYLHGDGASWIQKGMEIIPNSHFVLDRYHLEQALRKACPQRLAPDRWRRLHQLLDQSAIEEMALEIWACYEDAGVCSQETARATIHYLVNHWEGIEIANDPKHTAGGSCAEGLVGHLLSERLSTHAMSWSPEGAAQMASLRGFLQNGGQLTSTMFKKPTKVVQADIPMPDIKLKNFRFSTSPETAPWTNRRGTALYRLQKTVFNGGLGRVH